MRINADKKIIKKTIIAATVVTFLISPSALLLAEDCLTGQLNEKLTGTGYSPQQFNQRVGDAQRFIDNKNSVATAQNEGIIYHPAQIIEHPAETITENVLPRWSESYQTPDGLWAADAILGDGSRITAFGGFRNLSDLTGTLAANPSQRYSFWAVNVTRVVKPAWTEVISPAWTETRPPTPTVTPTPAPAVPAPAAPAPAAPAPEPAVIEPVPTLTPQNSQVINQGVAPQQITATADPIISQFVNTLPQTQRMHIQAMIPAAGIPSTTARDIVSQLVVAYFNNQVSRSEVIGVVLAYFDNQQDVMIGHLKNIALNSQISISLKEEIVYFLMNIASDGSLDASLRTSALSALMEILNNNLEISLSMVIPLTNIVNNDSSGSDTASYVLSAISRDANVAYSMRDPNVAASIKEGMVNPYMLIAINGSLDSNTRNTAFTALSAISRDPNVAASIKEGMVSQLISIAANGSEDFIARRNALVVLLGGIAKDPEVNSSYLKQEIANRIVTERNRDIWDRFGVLVMDEVTHPITTEISSTISRVLDALPETFSPPLISFGESGIFSASYNPDTGIIIGGNHNTDPNTYFHEIAHYIDFNVLTDAQHEEINRLFQLSGNTLANYAKQNDYGRLNSAEDFATMFEFYTGDTVAALTQAANSPGDSKNILSQKNQLIANILAHNITLSDGRSVNATYVFRITGDGAVIRKEVALTEQTVNTRTYLLPNFNVVYNEIIF
ncbi:MAG: hypothetical protein KKH29_04900 [Candidatus Omnitrophica bacterium]|nr:hypothetical protein [Candidatus Omnitrophota bacterium]MCG2706800.1 hypothetical protein [Candidatus Omnitrophota bacterium]